ncbi:MAG: hypothetical protein GY822_04795 [Deltaproteobacteria bacterium]|nr:hypothetical protein [Deltaproteobacteria bacterium]
MVLVGGMALFGFLGVLLVDAVVRVQDSVQNVAFTELWDKMLDRFLDNDVPRKKGTPKKKIKASVPKEKVTATRPSAPQLPELKPVTSSRADLQAPSPKEYARATSGAVEKARKESHNQARTRLDRIISGADL